MLEELAEAKKLIPKALKPKPGLKCYRQVKYVVDLSHYLTGKSYDLDIQTDTYIHWFRCKLNGNEIQYDNPSYLAILLRNLDVIETKGVGPQVKEYYKTIFNITSRFLDIELQPKDDIISAFCRYKTGTQGISYGDTRLIIKTFYTPEKFYAGLPKDFPYWLLDITFNDDEIIASWDD